MKLKPVKTIAISGALLIALCNANTAYAAGSAYVSSGQDAGAGSLRAALESGASRIRISSAVRSITLSAPLMYSGTRSLKLIGDGQVIDGSALPGNADIFTVSHGANVTIEHLTFVGNATRVNPNPDAVVGGKGIFVNVPNAQQGLVRVNLNEVTVMNVGNHGVHVSDCILRDACGGGSGGGGEGSPASVYVSLDGVKIDNVGFGTQDADGVRVDERGDGDIYFIARNSEFLNVGADGVELDEGNNGDVVADVMGSLFDSNGKYCAAVEFVPGSACDDDGDADVDDGFDIDEAGSGFLYARVRDSKISNNFDEGLDFDEEDAGSIVIRLQDVLASGNADEGIKASEEDEGDIHVTMQRVTTANNNGSKEGIELEEADAGDVQVWVYRTSMVGGVDEALKVEQADDGDGVIWVRQSSLGGLDLEGTAEK